MNLFKIELYAWIFKIIYRSYRYWVVDHNNTNLVYPIDSMKTGEKNEDDYIPALASDDSFLDNKSKCDKGS